jgi:hypothetical protein
MCSASRPKSKGRWARGRAGFIEISGAFRPPKAIPQKIWISKFSKRFHLAGIKYINDLMFAKTLVFQAFSKFLFGGFVGFQGLVVEKIWKTRRFQKSPAGQPTNFLAQPFLGAPSSAPRKGSVVE